MYILYKREKLLTTVDKKKANNVKECLEWVYPDSEFEIKDTKD